MRVQGRQWPFRFRTHFTVEAIRWRAGVAMGTTAGALAALWVVTNFEALRRRHSGVE